MIGIGKGADGAGVVAVGSLGAGVTATVGENVLLVGVGEGVMDASKKLQTPFGGGTSAPCVTTNVDVSFAPQRKTYIQKVVLTNCNHPREKPSMKTGYAAQFLVKETATKLTIESPAAFDP